jgi:hypothetical protein
VTVSGPPVIDNGQAGYSETGSGWISNTPTTAYNNNERYAAPGNGANTASWQTSALPNGIYDVQISWTAYFNRASNATYQVFDGTTLLGTVQVNQQLFPTGGLTVNGILFQSLGHFSISSGTLKVVLSDNANGYVIADAMLAVVTIIDLNWTGGSLTGPSTASTPGSTTAANATASCTNGACAIVTCNAGYADCDGVYDPGTVNGRLLLGLKGQISELELSTIRNRLHAALLQKAQRGELAQNLPAGLVRDEAGVVRKDPHQEVRSRIDLVFRSFHEHRATTKVVRFLSKHRLRLPRKNRWGEIVWRWPTTSSVASILQNPAYAGAYVRGRTQTYWKNGKQLQRRLPLAQWKICLRDQYPAYVGWEEFEKTQAMLQDNYSAYDRNRSRGVPRSGKALLHGLVCCGQCGHKMVVQYKGGTQYLCNQLRGQYQVPVCQRLPADAIDQWVVAQFFAAFAGTELDLYALAVQQTEQEHQHVMKAHQQQMQRLHYEANLAERQFRRADPDNRLVTAELERRWEQALRALAEAEEAWRRKEVQRIPLPGLEPEVRQALYLQGLDPIEETLADANSYGFRKQRCCADALAQGFKILGYRTSAVWILEGDIKACFDRINHDWMLTHIPMDKVILRKWLQAGFLEKDVFVATTGYHLEDEEQVPTGSSASADAE